jgi:hypothetical protein
VSAPETGPESTESDEPSSDTQSFPEGWLRAQIAKSAASLSGLPDDMRRALSQRTNMRHKDDE